MLYSYPFKHIPNWNLHVFFEIKNLETTAHELFHGYQHENGQGGASIFNEVEAYAFGYAVAFQYALDNEKLYVSTTTEGHAGEAYQTAFTELIYGASFSKDNFVSTVKNFKKGSTSNASGLYNKAVLKRTNQKKSMLSRFYPLIDL